MPSPNLIYETADRPEGFSDEGGALSLNLTDEQILDIIGKRVEDGKDFWNKKLKLDRVREDNEKRWLNLNYEVSDSPDLHNFECNYRDNRIFLSVETLVSTVVGKIPQPVITEAFDTDASRELAQQYGEVLKNKCEKELYLKGALQMMARHLLIGYRTGIIKLGWDFNAGRLMPSGKHTGDVWVKAIRPHKIVIDAEAEDPENIPLIAEYMKTTVEELGYLFPDKKDVILKAAGVERTDTVRLGKRADYIEIWFTYYDEGQQKEGVCWKIGNVILGKGVNPYYNYNNPSKSNFFDSPRKPYVLFQFLRNGRWVLDDTSLTEQAAKLQDVLEKRGRQIVDNADRANSTRVFNTQMIDASDVEKFVEDPDQSIMVRGDVRMAFQRVAPPLLPSYVMEDKYDARNEVDNLFGTHAPIRGEQTNAPTLGQEQISQMKDVGRTQPLIDSIERGAVRVYEYITQIYKVFATEEHMAKYVGDDGQTVHTAFSKDKIEDGILINLQSGSMAPDDKTKDKSEAVEMLNMKHPLDPLSFFEKLHVPNPREWAKRSVFFSWLPDRYLKEVLKVDSPEGQEKAMQVIKRINSGEMVRGIDDAPKDYVNIYSQFIQSPDFKQTPPEVQKMHILHIRETVQKSKDSLKMKESKQKPTEGPLSRLAMLLKGKKGE